MNQKIKQKYGQVWIFTTCIIIVLLLVTIIQRDLFEPNAFVVSLIVIGSLLLLSLYASYVALIGVYVLVTENRVIRRYLFGIIKSISISDITEMSIVQTPFGNKQLHITSKDAHLVLFHTYSVSYEEILRLIQSSPNLSDDVRIIIT